MRPILLSLLLLAPALAAAQTRIVADEAADANATLVLRGIEAFFNQGDFTELDALMAPDYVEHELAAGEAPSGSAGFRQFVTEIRTAFPDFRYEVDEVIAVGDRVFVRGRFTGTHQGAFIGMEPTGRRMDVPVMDVLRIEDGRVIEHWGMTDTMAMRQQLGAMED